MLDYDGVLFINGKEISSCFSFNIQKIFDELECYYYVKGVTNLLLFDDEQDIESEIELVVPAQFMLEGIIKQNKYLTDEFNYCGLETGSRHGFYLTDYLLVDGNKYSQNQLKDKFLFNSNDGGSVVGFAIPDDQAFRSIAEYEEGFVADDGIYYQGNLVTYYRERDVNRVLNNRSLLKTSITDLVKVSDLHEVSLVEETSLSTRKEENLLRTIGGLVLLLTQKPGNRFGKDNKPNVSAISTAVLEQLEALEVTTYGQSKSTYATIIPKAIKLILEE